MNRMPSRKKFVRAHDMVSLRDQYRNGADRMTGSFPEHDSYGHVRDTLKYLQYR